MNDLDTITVKVSDLYEQVKLMMQDKMDVVEISILEADEDFPEIGASISLSARKETDGYDTDYDDVYSV